MSSKNLPEPAVFLTGYNKAGDSVVFPQKQLQWGQYDNGNMPMATGYVAKMPCDLNNDADLKYDAQVESDNTGLVSKGSALLRYVDLAPAHTTMMHVTQSIDYGIVVGGEAECVMGSGEVIKMKVGDVCVQRYTLHAWRNPSQTQWARIVFSLMDCEPLTRDGKIVSEDLGRGAAYLKSSDN